jgi:hypothetical protein
MYKEWRMYRIISGYIRGSKYISSLCVTAGINWHKEWQGNRTDGPKWHKEWQGNRTDGLKWHKSGRETEVLG